MAKKDEKKKGKDKRAKKGGNVQAHDYAADYVPRFQSIYLDRVRAGLKEKFGYTNPMMVPRLEKIVVNIGLGDAAKDDLRQITGQQPIVRRARKSIASFKLRAGLPIGLKVTLRRNKMWEFADRLFSIALPRMRDFKGVSPKGFDGHISVGPPNQLQKTVPCLHRSNSTQSPNRQPPRIGPHVRPRGLHERRNSGRTDSPEGLHNGLASPPPNLV